jgi:hypothetical protein
MGTSLPVVVMHMVRQDHAKLALGARIPKRFSTSHSEVLKCFEISFRNHSFEP